MTKVLETPAVRVRGRFHRSVQLARDWEGRADLSGYLVTPTVRDLARRLLRELALPDGVRAWSLTGPYGTGKSSFALFLSRLLAGQADTHPDAPAFADLRPAKPLLPVLLVGQRAPLARSLAEALEAALGTLEPNLPADVGLNGPGPDLTDEAVVRRFETAAERVRAHGYGGLVVILDEFGKFLEYSAQGGGDLLVMQSLAEAASRSAAPFVLLTVLHTGFAEYLDRFDEPRRAEWQKVQGRFTDVAFQEPPEQLLKLLGTALEARFPDDVSGAYAREVEGCLNADALAEARARLPLADLLPACAPLHPLTALLLWPLFRGKFAQNERSLLSFLTSHEPFGLQEFLRDYRDTGAPFYRLPTLYDYVTTSLGAGLYRGEAEVKLKKGKEPERYAKLEALKIDEAFVSPHLLSEHEDLMRQGMWGVAELAQLSAGPGMLSFEPMQAKVNLELYREARRSFSLQEWRSLLLTSMGYVAESFSDEQQTFLLCRLLPLVQKNMHLMELAPKGTGKSYIFENISTQVRLVSGGNISPAVLFVNNASGQLGILARFKVVVLDEVQTLRFDKPEEIVGGLKGYLANGKMTRGGLHETSSDCGLVMLANIALDDQQRPLNDPIVQELPTFLQETAFLDRIKGIIPGWKLPKLSGKLLIGPDSSTSVGLKADFFGDVLLALRNDTSANQYCAGRVHLSGAKPYRRNEDSVRAIAAGLMKIQFPHGEVSDDEFRKYCLKPALELRQNVWDQLYGLDGEYRQFEQFLQAT